MGEPGADDAKEELIELRRQCASLAKDVAELKGKLSAAEGTLEHLFSHLASAILPGQLVALDPCATPEGAGVGSIGRMLFADADVVTVDFGGASPVNVPKSSLRPCREAELLLQPGTLVSVVGGGTRRAVICGPAPGACGEPPSVFVDVLHSDGHKEAHHVRDLRLSCRYDRAGGTCEQQLPLEVGDLVRIKHSPGASASSPPAGELAMVVMCVGDQAVVRCLSSGRSEPHDYGMHVDCLEIAWDCNHIRPGSVVRLRQEADQANAAIDLVHAVHAGGTTVVDFLKEFGHRCRLDELVSADAPSQAEVQVLRLLGLCASWHEVCFDLALRNQTACMPSVESLGDSSRILVP